MKRFMSKPKRRSITIAAFGLVVLATVAGLSVAGATPGSSEVASTPISAEATPTPPPPPPSSDRPMVDDERVLEQRAVFAKYEEKTAQAATEDEVWALKKELSDELENRGLGRLGFFSGPLTRGTEVTIAGKTVMLPEDAQLGGLVATAIPAVEPDGTCPACPSLEHLPWLRIIRGNSVVLIGENTGVVVTGRIAAGEEGAFDFLKQVFPDQAGAIDFLPIKLPEVTE